VQVPQYVAGSPSPPAVRALLGRTAETHRVDLRFQALDARVAAYLERVEEGLAARPDVKVIVDRLDQDSTAEASTPESSAELVDEIERFLRSQSEE
jgi:hypothetical protein